MAGVLDFLTSAAGGGVLGSVLKLGTDWAGVLVEGKRAKIQAELEVARAGAAERTEAARAFANSQAANTGNPFTVPHNAAPWASSLFTLCAAFREFTRPGLTWSAHVTVAAMYFFPIPGGEEFRREFAFAAYTAFFWWFGERYSMRAGAPTGKR